MASLGRRRLVRGLAQGDHLTPDTEDAGAEGWRREGRSRNDGLIQRRSPQALCPSRNIINEVPKISVIVHSVEPGRLEALAGQIINQRLDDLEIIIAAPSADTDRN